MNERGIREGMTVHSADGERLGKVMQLDADGFFVEKGIFFPKEYFCRYEFVSSVSGDDVLLSRTKHDLTTPAAADERLREEGRAPGGAALEGGRFDRQLGDEELRMTAAEEELDAVKHVRDAGEVRLRKDVVTETKHIEVPVTREEVRVERVPADAPRAAGGDEARFQEESVSMPIREEEVEIRKRPVVKEEVRLRKERVHHEQRADAEVRREEISVDDNAAGRTRTPGAGGWRSPGSRDDDIP